MRERLKLIREYLNMSQEQMGKRLGVNKATISRLETGVNKITEQMIKSICREFNINEEWFCNGIGEMTEETIETIIDELAIKYNLSKLDYETFLNYLKLDNESKEIISKLISKINSNNN